MKTRPGWLPELIPVDGEWKEVVARLYGVFHTGFRADRPGFRGMRVLWDNRTVGGSPYEEAFWHLITKGEDDQGRLLDPRRAERLGWCGAIIRNPDDASVLAFDYEEARGRTRTYLWLHEWDYCVVLQKRKRKSGDVYVLVTAYYVEGAATRRRLRRKFANRLRQNAIAARKDGERSPSTHGR